MDMKKAFSLVELSIVLVILGLLVGGILAGQSLIRAAELRSVAADMSKYAAGMNAFRDKYFAIAGDITNATRFWGIAGGATGSDDACWGVAGSGTTTCNGNGNGYLGHSSTACTNDTQASCYNERVRAWQHLANAGLAEGSYTGLKTGAETWSWAAGVNQPSGKIANTAFLLYGLDAAVTGVAADFIGKQAGNYLLLIRASSAGANVGVLKPEEAWNIDTKLDDGKPGTGIVSTVTATTTPNCASSDIASSATYVLSNSATACTHLFMKMP